MPVFNTILKFDGRVYMNYLNIATRSILQAHHMDIVDL